MTYLRASQPLKYIDIFQEAYSLANLSTCNLFCARLDVRVLAWTSHHEHAVFHLLKEIHPATVCVWFQYWRGEGDGQVDTIHKIELKDGKWKKAEVSAGSIPYANHNPFDPRKDNAASNTAESVFPQNQARDIRDAERHAIP